MTSQARGLCIQPLLVPGLPSGECLENILKDVDDQLDRNHKQLESCVGEIMDLVNGLPGSGKEFHNAQDAIDYMYDAHLLEKNSCYDPESEDITRLLKYISRSLDGQKGQEEAMLEQLLRLSANEGISLPVRSSMTDHVAESMYSLNIVCDTSEQINDALWDDICMKFRKYFIEQLQKMPVTLEKPVIMLSNNKRLDYVQSLCSLYPATEVWPRYRTLRTLQLESIMVNLLTDPEGDSLDFESTARNFEEVANIMMAMILEDFVLLNSGVFQHAVTAFRAIHEIYLDKLMDEITNVIDGLQVELSNLVPKELPKSSSEFGPVMSLKNTLRKVQSKSLDSLLSRSDDPFSDLVLPFRYIESIVKLLSCITAIENHVDDLHRTVTWATSAAKGTGKKKTNSSLRSALKSSSSSSDFSSRGHGLTPTDNSGVLMDAIPPPFGATPAMMSNNSSTYKAVDKSPHDERPPWDWRSVLKKIIPDLAKTVEQLVHDKAKRLLDREQEEYSKTHAIDSVPVCEDLVGGKFDYPRLVAKSVSEMMVTLDKVVQVIRVGSDGVFQVLRSTFIDTTMLNLRNYHLRITKILSDVSKETGIESMYLCLASAAFIRNHLLHYEALLSGEDTSRKAFPLLYRQFCELVDTITQMVTDHHSLMLCSVVLQDAESHHWNDSKEFYEDERGSFAIQMWNLYMHQVQHDLWSSCPPKLSQTILATLLNTSLSILAQRYTRAKPSYRRTKQFRLDVVSILLCTSELLVPTCSNISRYVDVTDAQTPHYSIHNHCTSLLAALAVVASPLDVIYKVYKKGFHKRKSQWKEESDLSCHPTNWLSWIQPNLFFADQKHFDEMQTTTAVYLQIKLLAAQAEPNWPALLQTLLMKDYAVPILLLTQATQLQNETHPTNLHLATVDIDLGCHGVCCRGKDCLTTLATWLPNVCEPVLHTLLWCTDFPAAFGKVLLPVIERTDSWHVLDHTNILGNSCQIPAWLNVIFSMLLSLIHRLIECGLRYLRSKFEKKCEVEPLTSVLPELPCGCKPSATENTGRTSHRHEKPKDIVTEAMRCMISQLKEDLHTLPTPLIVFFKMAQEEVEEKEVEVGRDCVGLQIIASCLRLKMSDTMYLESLTASLLEENIKDNMVMLSECLYHVLTSTSKGSGTPRIAAHFLKHQKEWIHLNLMDIVDHLCNEVYECPETSPLDGASVDFVEQYLSTLASSIMDKQHGQLYLLQIFHLIRNNIDWFFGHLDIPEPLSKKEPTEKHVAFNVTAENTYKQTFNPLISFNRIGNSHFDQGFLADFPIDWQHLLQADLGVSEFGFRALLYHRHEMQEGAYLEENEKKPVQTLKTRFDLEPAGLV